MFETKLIREPTIQLHNLENMDDKMYFYYDESNNFRKVRFNLKRLNELCALSRNIPIDFFK